MLWLVRRFESKGTIGQQPRIWMVAFCKQRGQLGSSNQGCWNIDGAGSSRALIDAWFKGSLSSFSKIQKFKKKKKIDRALQRIVSSFKKASYQSECGVPTQSGFVCSLSIEILMVDGAPQLNAQSNIQSKKEKKLWTCPTAHRPFLIWMRDSVIKNFNCYPSPVALSPFSSLSVPVPVMKNSGRQALAYAWSQKKRSHDKSHVNLKQLKVLL